MARKPISREDRDVLERLVETYSAAGVIRAAKNMPKRKGGRPLSNNVGNLASVYGYVEFHQKQRMPNGRLLRISGACRELERALNTHTVNSRHTWKRLRSLFYEAKRTAKSNPQLAVLMKRKLFEYESNATTTNIMLPYFMVLTKDGLRPIDRSARASGGKTSTMVPTKGRSRKKLSKVIINVPTKTGVRRFVYRDGKLVSTAFVPRVEKAETPRRSKTLHN
jgi:hypothetical protein